MLALLHGAPRDILPAQRPTAARRQSCQLSELHHAVASAVRYGLRRSRPVLSRTT